MLKMTVNQAAQKNYTVRILADVALGGDGQVVWTRPTS